MKLPPSTVLPPEARKLLQEAAQRQKQGEAFAVDDAIDRVRVLYPSYFNQEEIEP